MAFLNRGLTIILTDERPDHINGEPHVVSYRYDGGIADFVRYINASKEAAHSSVIEFGDEEPGISAEIAMQWSGSYSESVHTFANTINTAEGGTHEEGFRAALTTIINRRSEEHTSELQSRQYLVCRLLLEKKKRKTRDNFINTSLAPILKYGEKKH